MKLRELMPFIQNIPTQIKIPINVQTDESFTLQTSPGILRECRAEYIEWLAELAGNIESFETITTYHEYGSGRRGNMLVIRCCPITLAEKGKAKQK